MSRPVSSRCWLIYRPPEGPQVRVAITSEPTVLGRDPEADLFIDHATLSRRHAVFKLIDGRPYVEDLGSSNGVKVRGKRIAERARLADADEVRAGDILLSVEAVALPEPTLSLGPRLVGIGSDREHALIAEVRVGRSPDCDLQLGPSVSRVHARIERTPWRVVDEGSANGVHLNGARVRWADLRNGDELRFGDERFRVELGPVEGPRGIERARRWRWIPPAMALVASLSFLGAVVGTREDRPPAPEPKPAPQSPRAVTPPPPTERPRTAVGLGAATSSAATPLSALDRTAPQSASSPPATPVRPGHLPDEVDAALEVRFPDRPRWRATVRAYWAGDDGRAQSLAARARRSARLVAWLDRNARLAARARKEISNDPERALDIHRALRASEAQLLPEPLVSAGARELEAALVTELCERGERALRRSKYKSGHDLFSAASSLRPEAPRAAQGMARVQARLQSLIKEAELSSQRGTDDACRAWRAVVALSGEEAHRERQRRACAR